MKILSIDPGIRTGIASCTEFNGKEFTVDFSMTVSVEKILSNNFLSRLVAMATPDAVLVEGVPAFAPNKEQVELTAELIRWFKVAGYSVHEIQPSQWKGFVKRVEIPGTHARDAATMARWWAK